MTGEDDQSRGARSASSVSTRRTRGQEDDGLDQVGLQPGARSMAPPPFRPEGNDTNADAEPLSPTMILLNDTSTPLPPMVVGAANGTTLLPPPAPRPTNISPSITTIEAAVGGSNYTNVAPSNIASFQVTADVVHGAYYPVNNNPSSMTEERVRQMSAEQLQSRRNASQDDSGAANATAAVDQPRIQEVAPTMANPAMTATSQYYSPNAPNQQRTQRLDDQQLPGVHPTVDMEANTPPTSYMATPPVEGFDSRSSPLSEDDTKVNSVNVDDDNARRPWSFKAKLIAWAGLFTIVVIGAMIAIAAAVSSSGSQDKETDTTSRASTNTTASLAPTDIGTSAVPSTQPPTTANPTTIEPSLTVTAVPSVLAKTDTPTIVATTTAPTHSPTQAPTESPTQAPVIPHWTQLGEDLVGEAEGDQLGPVALSEDGTILAVGANGNDDAGPSAGHVRVFKYADGASGGSWIQMGTDVDGTTRGDNFGWAVALSADGSLMAASGPWNDAAGTIAGQVRVFEYNGTDWDQQGQDLLGEATGDEFGTSVALSADGVVLAAGGIKNDGNGVDSGYVQIYFYNTVTSRWVQMGQDLYGEDALDEFGASVALSADGRIVAAGSQYNNGAGGNMQWAGHIRVYSYKSGAWVQMGQDLDGEAARDVLGFSVALSADGKTVAAGGRLNDGNGEDAGHVRVYSYDDATSKWVQMGADLDGEAPDDRFGISVALSMDGTVLAVGAAFNDGSGADVGHVRVYKYISDKNSWVQLGEDLDGDPRKDYLGGFVALSGDGRILATGRQQMGTGANAGYARVFGWNEG